MCGTQGCGSTAWSFPTGPFPPLPEVKLEPDARTPFEDSLDGLLDNVALLMKQRHEKYGPGNIAKRGIPGILVRLDDKLSRLDNSEADFTDESYRDAWMDVVGYGLIALMWLDGDWPGSKSEKL